MRITSFTGPTRPQVGIYSYGTKYITALTCQWEFDVSQFRDPMGQKQFASVKGTDEKVVEWVAQDRRMPAIIDLCRILAEDLVRPHKKDGGKEEQVSVWLSIAFKDKHGTMLAPAIAEKIANVLSDDGFIVAVNHHNLSPKNRVLEGEIIAK